MTGGRRKRADKGFKPREFRYVIKAEDHPGFFDLVKSKRRKFFKLWVLWFIFMAYSSFYAYNLRFGDESDIDTLPELLFFNLLYFVLGLVIFQCYLFLFFCRLFFLRLLLPEKATISFHQEGMALGRDTLAIFSYSWLYTYMAKLKGGELLVPYGNIIGIYPSKLVPEELGNCLLEPGLLILQRIGRAPTRFRLLKIPYLFAADVLEELEEAIDPGHFQEVYDSPKHYQRIPDNLRFRYSKLLQIFKTVRF
jgi:hypothetical protein